MDEQTSRPASRAARFKPVAGWLLAGAAVFAATAVPSLDWRAWTPWGDRPGQVAPYRLMVEPAQSLEAPIAFYRTRAERDPQGFLDLNALADLYVARARASGDTAWYLLADRTARKSLQRMPTHNPGALLTLGQIAAARHDFRGAIAYARQASRYDPEGPLPLLVTAHLALGELTPAAKAAEWLATHRPGLDAYSQRGLVHAARGREAEAIADFERAIAREQVGQTESSAFVRVWLGRLHAAHGRHAIAEDLYREALRIRPGSPVALSYLAELEARRGRHDAAVTAYQDAYAAYGSAGLLARAAAAQEAAGNLEDARALSERAEAELRRDLKEDGFGHRRDLARLLLERGTAAAEQEALALMRAEYGLRKDVETLSLYARALSRAGRWAEAGAMLDQALATGYRDAELLSLKGLTERALGREAAARSWLDQALAYDPTFAASPAWQPLAKDGLGAGGGGQ